MAREATNLRKEYQPEFGPKDVPELQREGLPEEIVCGIGYEVRGSNSSVMYLFNSSIMFW